MSSQSRTAQSKRIPGTAPASRVFGKTLKRYQKLTYKALLEMVPAAGPSYLYDLVSVYPRRSGKGLRAALCLAMCKALGGSERQALNTAAAIELFHTAFLIHDDIQDGSESRRGGPTLYRTYGVGIGVNVGNAANLLALQRLRANRSTLGALVTWRILAETEVMLRQSLEGQAIELGWIRDNVCELTDKDYLRMCLKKTSWYSFIYPLRIGAIIAKGPDLDQHSYLRFGWYLGAAFQIQDDILNLTGNYRLYGKEIGGDLWEGKRTLMLLHLLQHSPARQRGAIERFLAKPRHERKRSEVEWLYQLMVRAGSIDFARRKSQQLAGAAFLEALTALREVADSDAKRFVLEMVLYVVRRNR